MSRSRKKFARVGFAYGDNRDFYRFARRHLRSLNRQELRKLLSNGRPPEEIEEKILGFQNKHDKSYDEWNEPTDGTYLLIKETKYWTKERIEKEKRK